MITGRVIHGDGIGKEQGFATANIERNHSADPVAAGVYAARAALLGKEYGAALIISDKSMKAEAYLLDYSGPDFYGEYISVEPINKVSDVISFDNADELIDKIEADLKLVRLALKRQI